MAGEMHAAVLHKARDLRYERIAVPEPKATRSDPHQHERAVRIGHPLLRERKARPVPRDATLRARPRGVRRRGAGSGGRARPSAGARVAVEPGIPCRRCEWCKKGRYNLCPDVTFLSAPPVTGTSRSAWRSLSDFAHPVPDAVSDEQAAFVEPISVGIQAAHTLASCPGHDGRDPGQRPDRPRHLPRQPRLRRHRVLSLRRAGSQAGAGQVARRHGHDQLGKDRPRRRAHGAHKGPRRRRRVRHQRQLRGLSHRARAGGPAAACSRSWDGLRRAASSTRSSP